jgi:hypothetical protein
LPFLAIDIDGMADVAGNHGRMRHGCRDEIFAALFQCHLHGNFIHVIAEKDRGCARMVPVQLVQQARCRAFFRLAFA